MRYRMRRISVVIVVAVLATWWISANAQPVQAPQDTAPTSIVTIPHDGQFARSVLETLAVKGRAPKTNYARTQFGSGWDTTNGCDMRNIILKRDLTNVVVDESCKVTKGTLNDPYTGKLIEFVRGDTTSDDVQIDHVIALSNAWQTGAQQLTKEQRVALANDPLELLAVDGPANQAKGDGDAATWLPPNKAFRCQYIARQIAVKAKYTLWVTLPEKQAMQRVLDACPTQQLPVK